MRKHRYSIAAFFYSPFYKRGLGGFNRVFLILSVSPLKKGRIHQKVFFPVILSLCLLFFMARVSNAQEETPGVSLSPSPLSSPQRGEEEKPPPVPVAEETPDAPAAEEKPGSAPVQAPEAAPAAIPPAAAPPRVWYVGTFGTGQAEFKFGSIRDMYIDEERGEIYILDPSSDQVFIINDNGTPLFSFKFFGKTGGGVTGMAIDKDGRIYVSGPSEVAVYDYKGEYIENLDFSVIPDSADLTIQSVVVDDKGYLYLGSGGTNARIITLDKDRKFVSQIESKNRFINVKSLHLTDEGFVFLDPSRAKVWKFDREGNTILSFGRLSSLLGGFSQPIDMEVDSKGRIYVVDLNRWMVIVFTPKGDPIIEFGGPTIFFRPSNLAVSADGQIFVADNSREIMVFKLIEELN